MARLRVTGKRFSINGMVGITLIAVLIVAVALVVASAVLLPRFAETPDNDGAPQVVAIVAPDDGLISVNADLSKVFVTVKYSDGSTSQVALSELVVTGLDTSTEGTVDNVVLDFGGYKQTTSFNVVPTTLLVEYVASTGGRIDGDTTQNITAGADATRVEAIPEEGYYFAGWSDGGVTASRLDTKISKSQRLIAVFERLRYTVIFYYPDGTTAREEEVFYGDAPTRVPRETEHNMQLYGYKFFAWDTDYSSIKQDTNIHPIFVKDSADFYLEYTTDIEGKPLGTSDALAYYKNGEEAMVRVRPNPQRVFVGWSVYDVDLQSWINIDPVMPEGCLIRVGVNYAVNFKATQTGTDEEYVLAFTPDENVKEIHVKAHFVYEKSTISFTSMSEKAFESKEIDYKTPIGSVFDVEDLDALSTHGYEFKGWYAKGGAVNPDGTPVIIDNNATFGQPTELVAYWQKRIFTVVFLTGDNENTSFIAPTNPLDVYDEEAGGRIVKAYYQDTVAGALVGRFPEEVPFKTNYTFKGWFFADEDGLPTNIAVDKAFKLENEISYAIPVFEVNTQKLTVSIIGSGSIYTLVYDEEFDVDNEVAISSQINMPVVNDYRIRLRASTGYALTSVSVNGKVTTGELENADGYYDITIGDVANGKIIDQDYYVIATYELEKFSVSVTNGTVALEHTDLNDSGNITYGIVTHTDATTVNDASFAFDVNYGSSVRIEITPKYGLYINSVACDGALVSVPNEATYYELIVPSVKANVAVVITYAEFGYSVTLPEAEENGSITADAGLKEAYRAQERPTFTAEASEGYYVKRIIANGVEIDPYHSVQGYVVNDIKVNGKQVFEGNDYRVTYLNFTIDGFTKNVHVSVEYAKLYYNVVTSYEGVGTVDKPFVAYYGESYDVKARTSVGNYVYSAIVTGGKNENVVYESNALARVYSITEIKEDFNVKFVFKKELFYVHFDGDGYVDVTFNGVTKNINADEGYTFSDIEYSSNAIFTITAAKGYNIVSVEGESNKGKTWSEDINYNTASHNVTLTAVDTSYHITIATQAVNVNYKLHFINKGENVITVNEIAVSGDSYATAQHIFGSTISAAIELKNGYSLSIDDVVVKNQNPIETYTYEALSGDYAPDASKGFYGLYTEGTNRISLVIYDVNTFIDVFVYFTSASSANNVVNLDSDGNGVVTATVDGSDIASGDSVTAGTVVTITATPTVGNVLEAIVVNGKSLVLSGLSYEITVTEDTYVYALFSETRYNVSVDDNYSNGSVATDKTFVEEGTGFNVKLTPHEGYYVTGFTIEVEGRVSPIYPLQTNELKDYTTGTIVYAFAPQDVTGNILIKAQFSAIAYELKYTYTDNGTVEGLGSTDTAVVYFNETKKVALSANDGYYISEVIINGASVSLASVIQEGTFVATGEYVAGNLYVTIAGNTTLHVTFSPMVYRVTLNQYAGGNTLVRKDGTAFGPANALTLNEGDTLYIHMMAEDGYHIESVIVNGIEDNSWKDRDVSMNDMADAFHTIENVQGDIRLTIIYAVNEYQIQVNVKNVSANFASIDTSVNSFGMVSITGYAPNENNTYTGFVHGSNVKFVATPRTARGYYISRFEIKYFNKEKGGALETLVLGANELSPTGGSYIFYGITSDIQAVNVEFARYTYTYEGYKTIDNLGSPFVSQGTFGATFTNPYSSAPVVLVNGMYEHGLNYTIALNPGVGYDRTAFTINGEDKQEAVRANAYVGIITGNIRVDTTYSIKKFDVTMSGNDGGSYAIFDSVNNALLWSPVDEYESEVKTPTGIVWATEQGITATYGQSIVFSSIPDSSNGYRISNFEINGESKTIADEDAVLRFTHEIVRNVDAQTTFSIHVYTVKVNNFIGGNATVSTSTVVWNQPVTVRLNMQKGYELASVEVNGDLFVNTGNIGNTIFSELQNGSYTFNNVTENIDIIIALANKKYDITFYGEYNKLYAGKNANGDYNARAGAGVIINQGSTVKREHQHFVGDGSYVLDNATASAILRGDNSAVFEDRVLIVLLPPVGYSIKDVTISMEDNEGLISNNLVISANKLQEITIQDAEGNDVSGYAYTVGSMTGKIAVHISYEVKTYVVRKNTPIGYDTAANADKYVVKVFRDGAWTEIGEGAVVSHHETIMVNFTSLNGYYLSSLAINGKDVAVGHSSANANSSIAYNYWSTLILENGGIGQLVVDDALLNGRGEVSIVPTTTKQSFKVIFYVNRRQVVSTGHTDPSLGLYLENAVVTYDDYNPNEIIHTLANGYSITGIYISLNPISNFDANNLPASVYVPNKPGDKNTYSPKDQSLKLYLTSGLYEKTKVDFHSASANTLRIYYTTALDVQELDSSMYYVRQSEEAEKANVNVGGTIASHKDFALNVSYSDGLIGKSHNYGTVATLRANINGDAINKYSFQGFQEKLGDTWVYVEDGVSGIKLENDGQTMRYEMTSSRTFRAVFFRLYEIVVKVKPDYKYVEGNFGSSNPDLMKYRRYASITASVTYAENNANGVILPKNADRTVLSDCDGNTLDSSYTFRVLSGASLELHGKDNVSMNNSNGQTYTSVVYEGGRMTQREEAYENGVTTLEDRLVYAYFDNNVYVSFAMETIGSEIAAEGATITYKVNGNTVALNKNSIITKPNQNIEVTIVPKENFRYENILRSIRVVNTNNSNEYLQFSSQDYTELTSSSDGTISITCYDEAGREADPEDRIARVVLKLNNCAENAIFKIVLRKQIKLNRSISLVTDETSPEVATDINQLVAFTDDSAVGYSSSNGLTGLYDYQEKLYFNLYFKSDLLKHYQFVGYFINGVNVFSQLQQRYPYLPADGKSNGDYELKDLSLDDIGGLGNGVKIKTVTNSNGVVDYVVEVVAKFVPIYNVVVENEYLDGDVYLDPGSIISSAVVYDSSLPQYFETPFNSEANLSASDDNAQQFKMLGKLNGIDHSAIKNEKSPYNVWNDNMLTLSWQQRETTSGAFVFIAWQYLAYVPGDQEPLQWKNIPYSDPNNASNAVTKTKFTFPISKLFATSYMPYLYDDGTIGNPIVNGELSGSYYDGVPAIYLRAKYQKVETLKIQKATAMQSENDYYPGQGDVMPTIYGTSSASGNFNYGTVQTMSSNLISGYEFVGWGLDASTAWNAEGVLNYNKFNELKASAETVKIGTVDYYKITIQDVEIICNYGVNGDSEELSIYMDGSYSFVAYYRRVYTISVNVTNISGISPILTDSLPTIIINDNVTSQRFVEGSFIVGSTVKIQLTYQGVADKVAQIAHERYVDWTPELSSNANYALESDGTNITNPICWEVTIPAQQDLEITINFKSVGTLVFEGGYPDSYLRLPKDMFDGLAPEEKLKAQYARSGYVKLDSTGAATMETISINSGVSWGVGSNNEYATALGAMLEPLSGGVSYYINFDGSTITEKTQKVTLFTANEMPFATKNGKYGVGSSTAPFYISTLEHLRTIDDMYKGGAKYSLTGLYFEQINDIVLTDSADTLVEPLCAAGNDNKGFDGTYDGAGYALTNLIWSGIYANYVGIFAKITNNAIVKNLIIGTTQISSSGDNVGALAGYVANSSIREVYFNNTKGTLDTSNISGNKSVGGLIGKVSGTTTNIVSVGVSDVTIKAAVGSEINVSKTSVLNHSAGAGGIVGVMESGSIDTANAIRLVVESPIVAGGIVGSLMNGSASLNKVKAQDVKMDSDRNGIAIGGIAGYAGVGTKIEQPQYKITNSLTIRSASVSGGFISPTADTTSNYGSYINFGGGGIVGFNRGTITGVNGENTIEIGSDTSSVLTLTGSMVGGIAGVNFGTINGVSVKGRMFTPYTGGVYGGIVGYNTGNITNSKISGYGTSDDYNANNSIYEVAKAGRSGGDYYTISGSNDKERDESEAKMVELNVSADSTYIYVGGVAGYDVGGTISNTNVNGKIMVNRRNGNQQSNNTYIGAVCGFRGDNNAAKVSNITGTVYIKFTHYIAVDQKSANEARMYTYVGDGGANVDFDTGVSVSLTAMYIGGGSSYSPVTLGAFDFENVYAKDYNEAHASLYRNNLNSYTADSYVPSSWNEGEAIKDMSDDGKAYSNECQKSGDGIFGGAWKVAWNYTGYLRYVAIS
ncbi:MAG: InlB B-repeat-containing protein [Clostridia bacterium]|nr:InlB B-repeat-containing protein [Clostridia bacterium]